MDESRNVFIPPEPTKRLLCFQETRRCPAHGHVHVAIVGDPSAHPPHHGVRGLDYVGGGQTAREFPGHAESVDREQLLQALEQTGGGIQEMAKRSPPSSKVSNSWRAGALFQSYSAATVLAASRNAGCVVTSVTRSAPTQTSRPSRMRSSLVFPSICMKNPFVSPNIAPAFTLAQPTRCANRLVCEFTPFVLITWSAWQMTCRHEPVGTGAVRTTGPGNSSHLEILTKAD